MFGIVRLQEFVHDSIECRVTSFILPCGAWFAKIVCVQVPISEISYLALIPHNYVFAIVFTRRTQTHTAQSHSTVLCAIAIDCVRLCVLNQNTRTLWIQRLSEHTFSYLLYYFTLLVVQQGSFDFSCFRLVFLSLFTYYISSTKCPLFERCR